MANPIYKNPLAQSEAISKVPPFDKDALIDFFTQYGDFMTDEGYEAWAKEKGKTLGPIGHDALGETRYPDYINDEDYLKDAWNEVYEDAIEYKNRLATNPDELKSIRDARKIRGWREGDPTINFKEDK